MLQAPPRKGGAYSATHLRRLIDRLHPGVSVRQLCLTAGSDKLAYYLKPTTVIATLPPLGSLEEVARTLDCDLELVVEAFMADLGIPSGPPRHPDARRALLVLQRLPEAQRQAWLASGEDPDAAALLALARAMSAADRQTLLRVAQSLAGGPLP